MARLASAALSVRKEDIQTYEPEPIDIAIAQSFLEGAISIPELSDATRRAECAVRKKLKDPVAFAWIAHQVSALMPTRKGMVDAALFRKAVAGDVKAIELWYKRFGALTELKIIAHGNLGDLTTFTDKDLDSLIEAEVKTHPHLLPEPPSPSERSAPTVVDVTPTEERS